MATYSRSQTTTQTSQQSAAMPSMDISSLLVKTMENVMSDEENGNKDLEKTIADAINSSDLLKDKTRNDKDKELTDLLKDKKNSDKELSNFLKEANKNLKDSEKERKESTVKSTSDKITNVLGKLVAGGAIGSAITGIMGAKGVGGALKGAASGAISGTGKVAGGLVSGVGNIGGTLIAGVGKLFGPVGAIIGKAVGAAVAAPFKIVGGTITAAIGGLGKLLSMPLKELVTKGTLIVAVLSQLFVFLEGLMAKFIAEKDIKWIDFMSKLKASITTIPDRLILSIEKTLSKVRVLGQPIFGGGLTKDEKKELKALEKKDSALGIAQDKLMQQAGSWIGKSEASNYNIADPEQREALKQAMLAKTKSQVEQGMVPAVSEYDINKYFSNYEKRSQKSKLSPEEIERLGELRAIKEGGRKDWDAEEAAIEAKERSLEQSSFAQGVASFAAKPDKNGNARGLTQYQQNLVEEIGGQGTMATVRGIYQTGTGSELTTRDPTGAERFLANQYKAWTDSIATAIEHGFQNTVGIKLDLKQKFDQHNPTIKK